MAKTCPNCGHKTDKDTATFCNMCQHEFDLPQKVFTFCGCSNTKKPFAMRFERQKLPDWEGWVLADAFVARQESVDRGGYGHLRIEGKFRAGAKCPFCGAASFYPVHEKFTCWDGATNPAPCAWCNEHHQLGGEMTSADVNKDI